MAKLKTVSADHMKKSKILKYENILLSAGKKI